MSEAICGIAADPHIASLMRATIAIHNSAFSRQHPPEFCKFIGPQRDRGRREDRVRAAPAVSCARNAQANAHEHTGSAEAVRPSLRNGFTAYIVLSPARPGLFVTVAPKKREPLKNLTPAIGASGPHDFAVRFSRARQSQLSRPPLPAPNVRDDRDTPLSWGTGWPEM
jgi:hypothetical protein